MDLSNTLLIIYIGQHIRDEGMLFADLKMREEETGQLAKLGMIKETKWYSHRLLICTEKGLSEGSDLVTKRLVSHEKELREEFSRISPRAFSFLVNRFVVKQSVHMVERDDHYESEWEDRILREGRIWLLYHRILALLEKRGLCFRTRYYVSTRGGETREMCFVIPPEVQEWLASITPEEDLLPQEESLGKSYHILKQAEWVLQSEDQDWIRTKLYDEIQGVGLEEGELGVLVYKMATEGITSEYRGLLSEEKAFDIHDTSRYDIWLRSNLLKSVVSSVMGLKELSPVVISTTEIPSEYDLETVRTKLGIVPSEIRGELYNLLADFELTLRKFIKNRMGPDWKSRVPDDIRREWKKQAEKEKKEGLVPEEDPFDYAICDHYFRIIDVNWEKFFSDEKTRRKIRIRMEDWRMLGRNPVAHFRTIDDSRNFGTRRAIAALREWMDPLWRDTG